MEAVETGLSSLIVTLNAQATTRAAALTALALRQDLQLGELGGNWIPAVLESADPRTAFREIEAIPGVEFVEVVFVELTAPDASQTATLST